MCYKKNIQWNIYRNIIPYLINNDEEIEENDMIKYNILYFV